MIIYAETPQEQERLSRRLQAIDHLMGTRTITVIARGYSPLAQLASDLAVSLLLRVGRLPSTRRQTGAGPWVRPLRQLFELGMG